MITTVCRKEQFCAAHRLYNPKWSEEENNRFYGLCANPNYHGHNYTLIVRLTGKVDAETGYLIDIKLLSRLIKTHITSKFDHKNFNLDVEEFRDLIPSTENIAFVIWNILRENLDSQYELHITLYETERNFVEYSGK